MQTYEIHGIDISHYQSKIDWNKVATQDIHFAFVKATEGNTLQDKHFSFNWKEMRRVGIKRGAYHFFRPEVSAKLQAENFINQVALKEGDLPPVIDIEVTGGLDKEKLVEVIKEWLLLIEVEYKIRPIIYSGNNFYREYLADAFPGYPVWIARYGYFYPNLGAARTWDFWQYGNRGRLEGIEGDVDLNVFRGTADDLQQFCLPGESAISVLSVLKISGIFQIPLISSAMQLHPL